MSDSALDCLQRIEKHLASIEANLPPQVAMFRQEIEKLRKALDKGPDSGRNISSDAMSTFTQTLSKQQ